MIKSGSYFRRAFTWGTVESRDICYTFMDFKKIGLAAKGKPTLFLKLIMMGQLIYLSIIKRNDKQRYSFKHQEH